MKSARGNRFIDLTGMNFGRLTVLSMLGCDKRKHFSWLCRCECGNTKKVLGRCLREGITRSCGCLRVESQNKSHVTHGMRNTPVYMVWRNMRGRCLNKNHKAYDDYGGRGIGISKEWEKFEVFFAEMGDRPSSKHTLERRDNMSGYSRENCYWATMLEQGRNKRNNRIIEFAGIRLCLSQWAEKLGLTKNTIQARLRKRLAIKHVLRPFNTRS